MRLYEGAFLLQQSDCGSSFRVYHAAFIRREERQVAGDASPQIEAEDHPHIHGDEPRIAIDLYDTDGVGQVVEGGEVGHLKVARSGTSGGHPIEAERSPFPDVHPHFTVEGPQGGVDLHQWCLFHCHQSLRLGFLSHSGLGHSLP